MITRIPRSAALRAYSAVRPGDRCAEVTSISYAIPKPSRALPHSCIISRSESLPITIETTGLLIPQFLPFYRIISLERVPQCLYDSVRHRIESCPLPHRRDQPQFAG